MFRRMSQAVIAALLLVGGVALAVAPAQSQAIYDSPMDLQVSLVSKPVNVSPAGTPWMIEATVTQGEATTEGTLSITLPAGASYLDNFSTSGCQGDGTAVTCPIANVSEDQVFQIVANSPTTNGTKTTSARVDAPLIINGLLVEDDRNNTASVQTVVSGGNTGTNGNYKVVGTTAAGFIGPGGSLTLQANDGSGRYYTIAVPATGVPGVIVKELSLYAAPTVQCGTVSCGRGFFIDFQQDAYFKAQDPSNPLIITDTFGTLDPCRGLGACSDAYYAESKTSTTAELQPGCIDDADSDATADDINSAHPIKCIVSVFKKDGSNNIWYDGRMLSNDPLDVVPSLTKQLSGG